MFTGIIETTGEVVSLAFSGKAAKLAVKCKGFWDDLAIGDSIAIDGVCLTAKEINGAECSFDVSRETLDRSILGKYRPKSRVNMEKALLPTDRLGGHFVQGHVDGVGKYIGSETVGENIEMSFEIPEDICRYVVEKGSISINGISLTAASINGSVIKIALIPHTLTITNLSDLSANSPVNLECDIIAKYVEKLLSPKESKGIDLEFLTKRGFK